jgi:hypothetical protein
MRVLNIETSIALMGDARKRVTRKFQPLKVQNKTI